MATAWAATLSVFSGAPFPTDEASLEMMAETPQEIILEGVSVRPCTGVLCNKLPWASAA